MAFEIVRPRSDCSSKSRKFSSLVTLPGVLSIGVRGMVARSVMPKFAIVP